MLKELKLVATACCIAALLTACQKDKEVPPAAEPAKTTESAPAAPATEAAKPAENVAPANPATPATTDPAAQTAPATPAATDPAAKTSQAAPAAGTNDPFAYCESVGTIDKPAGEALPEKLIQAMVKANLVTADMPMLKEPGFVQWRCMDKKVMACVVGANIPCEAKADISKEPNAGMTEFCKTEANADNIPAAATGRETVYMWSCKDGKPMVGEQVSQVDAQGFAMNNWTAVAP